MATLQFLLKKINLTIHFENIIVGLRVLYILNTHVKLYASWLFTIQSINLFFIYNFNLQKLEI